MDRIYKHFNVCNALQIETGNYSKQTECLIFPKTENEKDWFLTIETKYSKNEENVFRVSNKYPENVIDKIIKTVAFLRDKGLISNSKKVWAMVSFPKLFKEFSESFFTDEIDLNEIFFNHKIIIKATNKAKIISEKRIKLL